MNCDLCTYRVRLPGYEDKVGTPISLTPHGDGPARGRRRTRRATRAPLGRARDPAPVSAARARRGRRAGRPPALSLQGLALRLSGRDDGAGGRRPVASRPASGWPSSGPNGAGQDDARAGRVRRAGRPRGRCAWAARCRSGASCDGASGSSSRTPTTSCSCRPSRPDVAFGPANQGLRGEALRARVDEALDAVRADRARRAAAARAERGRAPAGGHRGRAGLRARRARPGRADRRARPGRAAASCSTCWSRCGSRCCWSRTTCPTRSSCARAPSCSTAARSSPTAPTREVLADDGFMPAHRLELPAGFNPLVA